MDEKIIIYVQHELATSSTVFSECNDYWDATDLYSYIVYCIVIYKTT